MKKVILLILLMSLTRLSFAQQTFTSKKDALEFLKEAFSKNFIKTPVIINSNNKEISYDYTINEDHIVIIEKTGANEIETWVTVPYAEISEYFLLKKNDYFKKVMGIGFKPVFGGSYRVSWSKAWEYDFQKIVRTKASFPFEYTKGDLLTHSVINAINTIARENKADTKIIKPKVDLVKQEAAVKDYNQAAIDLKIEGTFLKNYSLYNSENTGVNMHEFIERNRRFKDKPTLVITWSHTWCPPCLKRIDEILNTGIAANYNIAIVNKDGKTDYADIKSKISIRKTDYFTNDILFLIDRKNQLEALDKNSAPMFIWLDKKLAIKGIYNSYDITISAINSMFQQIE